MPFLTAPIIPNPCAAPHLPRPVWFTDAAIVALLVSVWLIGLTGPILRTHPVAHDTYRDAASAEHMIEGHWSDDPALPGYSYWYAPLGPLLYSLVARIAAVPALDVYATSLLWVNVWILPALYLLVARSFDRPTGITACLFVAIGSRWWSDNLALPIPAVQGLVPALLTLWAWTRARCGERRWAILTGVLLATCTWHHVLCGIVVATAIGGHAILCDRTPRTVESAAPLRGAVIVAVVCGLLAGPLAWHLAALPLLNPVPPTWIAGEVFDARYALHAEAPLVVPLALVGIWLVWRNSRNRGGWVLAYLTVGLVGQAPAYLNTWLGTSLPVLLPHEFQWHGQLAAGVLASVAAMHLARVATRSTGQRLAARPADRGHGTRTPNATMAVGWAWTFLVTLTLGPAGPSAIRSVDDRWITATPTPAHREAAEWIKSNTDVYDVFLCDPQTGYRVVGALTGRKLTAPLPGYANIAAPVELLGARARRMLETGDRDDFLALIAAADVRYVFVDDSLWDRLPRWRSFGVFDRAFSSSDGRVVILRRWR